jgi:hypothetical protein
MPEIGMRLDGSNSPKSILSTHSFLPQLCFRSHRGSEKVTKIQEIKALSSPGSPQRIILRFT